MINSIKAAIAILVFISGNSFAQEEKPNHLNTEAKSKLNFPVIIKNEAISPTTCRLHYEDGTSREISCKNNKVQMS